MSRRRHAVSLERSPMTPIVAIATSPGRGAIGVVRVSGNADAIATIFVALTSMNTLANPQNDAKKSLPKPREATLLPFLAADGTAIDRGLVIHFPAPHSYTGEDVLEFQAHGGPVVLSLLLARCLEAGHGHAVRAARPGEFTERAYRNGKLDLTQAEAVADLIDASTVQAARSASLSLSGAFSEQVHTLLADLINLRMLVEATLDFPEEEIEHLSTGKATAQLHSLLARTQALGAKATQGSLLREGLRLVIAGQPNVGKSSMLNALAGAEVAIVTPIAGTTRDKIEHGISLGGIPVQVVDTAGLRETEDTVERMGIARTWGAVKSADAILFLRDLTAADPDHAAKDAELRRNLPGGVAVLEVWNKADAVDERLWPAGLVVSATTGQGLAALRDAVLAHVGFAVGSQEGLFMARARHVQALKQCVAHLELAKSNLDAAWALDVVAEDLRLAQNHLGEITGEFSADALLGEIFSRFCIGK